MTPEEKKALKSLERDLYNYPEMVMITVARKDLELIVKCLKTAQKKSL